MKKASKGFEPLISCLLGRRFTQLSHDAAAHDCYVIRRKFMLHDLSNNILFDLSNNIH